MADKALSTLTAGTTPLDGTELFYVVQGSNSRKVAGSDVVKIAHTQAFSSITSTPTTLSGYGITDAQAKSSKLTTIAGLSSTDSGFIVGDGSTWTVESGSTARASLGLAIGSDVQAYSADLVAIAGLDKDDGGVIIGDGTSWTLESGATLRTSLGLSIGSDVQAYDASLNSLSGLTLNSGDILYSTGPNAFTNLSKGADGQVLVLSSGLPSWANVAGTGDMISAVYDPDGTGANAFDQDNMVDGTTNKNYTATEQSKLADAVVKSDTSVSGFSFTVDEDDMASNSDTLLPTQQSVKAYVDTSVAVKYAASNTALKALNIASDKVAMNLANEDWWLPTSANISAQITAGDPRYLPTSGDATGASGGWYQAGSVSSGQYQESSGARYVRGADMLRFGAEAIKHNGKLEVNGGTGGFLWDDTGGLRADGVTKLTTSWMEQKTIASFGGIAGVTGDVATTSAIKGPGLGSIHFVWHKTDAIDPETRSAAWATYIEGRRDRDYGTTWGCELDIVNMLPTPNSGPYDPYGTTAGHSSGAGTTLGLMLASGGGGTLVAPQIYDADVALAITSNGAKFLTGISIAWNAIAVDSATNRKPAIKMVQGHSIDWHGDSSHQGIAAYITSSVLDPANLVGLTFASNTVQFKDASGANFFSATGPGNAASYVQFTASASTSPVINVAGPGSNLNLTLAPKGTTGLLSLSGGSFGAKIRISDTGIGFLGTSPVADKTGWGVPTGTLLRTTYASYAGATHTGSYVQATIQALDDAVKAVSQRLAALITDFHQTAGYGLLRT
jgi:hypothetical protein